MDLPLLRRPGQDKGPLRSYRQVPIVAGNATWVSHFPQTLDLKHQHGMKLDHESEPLLAQPRRRRPSGESKYKLGRWSVRLLDHQQGWIERLGGAFSAAELMVLAV